MTVPTTAPVLDDATLARQYGWALSLLQTDPELNTLFHKAVGETWDADRFAAEVRNTNWYKTHSESLRQNIALQATDPATYASKRDASKTQFYSIAAQMGADINGGIADNIAQNAFDLGWSEQQIKDHLAAYVDYTKPGYGGTAGAARDSLNQFASQMGVKMASGSIENWAKLEAQGLGGVQQAKQAITNQAISAFPPLADRIRGGESVQDIASPYKQAMGSILEMNPDSVDLYDPTIRSALLSKGQDGKPAMKSIWEFENGLRQDPRWFKTKNAQDSVESTTRKILTDMGLAAGN